MASRMPRRRPWCRSFGGRTWVLLPTLAASLVLLWLM